MQLLGYLLPRWAGVVLVRLIAVGGVKFLTYFRVFIGR